jgi:hypothetical protein
MASQRAITNITQTLKVRILETVEYFYDEILKEI